MELDFDKEIDALLRKAQRDAPVLVGDFASQRHLDADEISAFAENAMPENSRALYTRHLAECDRCRSILSSLLVMNAEAAPLTASAPPSAITIAERSTPWYKRLFLFPNLAYVMGSLVLIFAGFLGYTVLRNTGAGESSIVSQVGETERAQGGPNFGSEAPPQDMDASAMAANSNANAAVMMQPSTSANSMLNSADESKLNRGPVAGARGEENNFVLDGVDAGAADVAAAPPPVLSKPAAAPKEAADRDDKKIAKAEEKLPLQESAKNDLMLKQAPNTGMSPMASQSGPSRQNERQYDRQLENLDRRAAAKSKSAREEEKDALGRRVVGGKTFERKERVWYDTTYQGRPTINVRRGTDEFNRLDGNLRSIANALGGTVVIVWGAKAYRIQ